MSTVVPEVVLVSVQVNWQTQELAVVAEPEAGQSLIRLVEEAPLEKSSVAVYPDPEEEAAIVTWLIV
jgi:hypothetical protein